MKLAAKSAPTPKNNLASASGPTNSAASPLSLNNWGQININFQSKGVKPKGAERFLVLQYEEAPLGFTPFD